MKNRLILVIVLVGLLLTGAAVFFGANIGRPNLPITGRVIDAVDTPVPGATVKLVPKDAGTSSGSSKSKSSAPAKTDSKGRFSIPAPSADGSYKIVATKSGESTDAPVQISGGRQKQDVLLSLPLYARDYAKIPPVNSKDIVVDEDGRNIVKNVAEIVWNKGVTEAEQDKIIAKIPGAKLRGRISEFNLTEIDVADGGLGDALALLKKEPKVKAALKDYIAYPDELTFEDPDYADADKKWWLDKVEAQQAWEVNRANPKMVVAVIDAGFERHPDLRGVLLKRLVKNYTDSPLQAVPFHGNHVSGIIGMVPNNLGGVGVSHGVKIMPIKVASFANMADGIRLASITNRVRVISLSMGTGWSLINAERTRQGQPPATDEQMKAGSEELDAFMIPAAIYAKDHNRILVHAAGNDYQTANYNLLNTPLVVTVANTDRDDSRAPASNFGPLVTIAAPGEKIWSTIGDGNWEYLSGTSMSTPLVSGIVALVRSANLRLTVDQTIQIIKDSAEPISAPDIGKRINAWQAVLAATDKWGVTGEVVSGPQDTPVAGASVYPEGHKDLAVTTKADGSFIIPGIPRGSWKLIAKKERDTGRLDVPALADKKYVLRGAKIRILNPDEPVPQDSTLMIAGDLPLQCVEKRPGQPDETRQEQVKLDIAGHMTLGPGEFTASQDADHDRNSATRGESNTRISSITGQVSSLAKGGTVEVSVTGSWVYFREVPMELKLTGPIAKVESFEDPIRKELAQNDFFVDPAVITLKPLVYRPNLGGRGVCTYTQGQANPLRQPDGVFDIQVRYVSKGQPEP